MKLILKKRIVPLLCLGFLLCTPHTVVFALDGGMTAESSFVETAPAVETVSAPEEISLMDEVNPAPEEDAEQTNYSVEIACQNLAFDYVPLWNPDEHCYDGWESTENPITVTNSTGDGAPLRVTLTFVPTQEMGVVAVFSPCKDDPNPDDFEFSDGQVTFLLPRSGGEETQATVNLSLSGDPLDWEIEQYTQIGAIKTETVSLHDAAEDLEKLTSPSDAQESHTAGESEVPPQTAPIVPSQPKPPTVEELTPPETEAEKSEAEKQKITPNALPPPENDKNEQAADAPPIKSGDVPQEDTL